MRMFCFDLDDTLVSEAEYVECGLAAVGARVDELCRRPGAIQWLIASWRQTRARDLYQQLLAERGLPVELVPELIRIYRQQQPALRLRPGVAGVLRAIHEAGDALSLISDGHAASQRRKWAALPHTEWFRPVLFTDEQGPAFWKPCSWAFEQVMTAAAAAELFVYVGDNPRKDFVAPNRLGWTTVQLRPGDGIHAGETAAEGGEPTIVLDDITQLLARVDQWWQGRRPS